MKNLFLFLLTFVSLSLNAQTNKYTPITAQQKDISILPTRVEGENNTSYRLFSARWFNGAHSVPFTSDYTTNGEASITAFNTSSVVVTLRQSTDFIQGKFITVYTGNELTTNLNYVEIRSHDTTNVKIEGKGNYKINTKRGYVTLLCTGTSWIVVNGNWIANDVLLIQNGVIRSYPTIYLANNDATNGGTIVLLKDITMPTGLQLKVGVSIDGNGHSIVGTGTDALDLFYVTGGISKIFNLKKVSTTRTDNQARWIISAFGGSKVSFECDEIEVAKGSIALAGNANTVLTIKCNTINLGDYFGNGVYGRKVLANDRASIIINAQSIFDTFNVGDSYGFIASVTSVNSSSNSADTTRAYLEFVGTRFYISRPFIVERMGELTFNNCKINSAINICVLQNGDPYTASASSTRHYSRINFYDSQIFCGSSDWCPTCTFRYNSGYGAIHEYSVSGGSFETYYHDINFYGTNIVSTSATTGAGIRSSSTYQIKNFGLVYYYPTQSVTAGWYQNQPILLGSTTGIGASTVTASSPLASSGGASPNISFQNQTANTVLAGPSSGSSSSPGFRALVAADIPFLDWSKINTGKPTTLFGYGITDGVSTTGSYSNPSWLASLAWSKITGTPTTLAGYGITSPLTVVEGGTNSTTANGALNNLLPSQTGNSGKVLQTDGTNATWQTPSGSSLPSQTGNAGKWLGTDGTTASWNTGANGTFGSASAVPVPTIVNGIVTSVATVAITASTTVSMYVRPESYGAVRNGSTNDATAINSALSAISTAGGGILYLTAGTYQVTSTLNVPSNCYILGETGATIRMGTTGVNTLTISTKSNVTIRNVTFAISGSASNATTSGHIYFSASSNCNVENCTFTSSHWFAVMTIGTSSTVFSSEITIRDNTFGSLAADGGSGNAPSFVNIEKGSVAITVENNKCTGTTGAIGVRVLSDASGWTIRDINISKNTIKSVEVYGIICYSTNHGNVYDVRITDNYIRTVTGLSISGASGAGIYCADVDDITITNNTVRLSNQSSSSEMLTPGSIGLNTCYRVVVSNNKLHDSGYHGMSIKNCTEVNGSSNQIINPKIVGLDLWNNTNCTFSNFVIKGTTTTNQVVYARSNTDLTISGGNFTSNGVYHIIHLDGSSLNSNVNIIGVKAKYTGTGDFFCFLGAGSYVNVNSCNFENTSSNTNKRLVYIVGMTNSTFSYNQMISAGTVWVVSSGTCTNTRWDSTNRVYTSSAFSNTATAILIKYLNSTPGTEQTLASW